MNIEELENLESLESTDQPEGKDQEDRKEDRVPEELHKIKLLSGMYKTWFLDYASYVILERAVPHVYDGFKPVHRRILHAMKRLDDGRYNKVANIIGHTMQFHPHGDASIGDALVQLGQKELLIDTQGNWGNTLTGDGAAAPRYIEARLSKFALEVVFNPKTTFWKQTYDGRNKEPITLPVKFPLLLAQGVEGIAVGLASKILPHNFIELIDASVDTLNDKEISIYPDFPSGGLADFSRYNDGLRGGNIRVRAKISKVDKKTLVITELPFGKTTTSLIESIIRANDSGKIKIKKIDDNTAENVEIIITLAPGISPDKTIDALYKFSDCEVSVSPNCCIIEENKPRFIGVSEILHISVNNTVNLLKRELQIRLEELNEDWHFSSLEKIFIENRIYNDIEDCETWESIIETIDKGLKPFIKKLKRKVTHEDIAKLTEIKIKRISKYDSIKTDEHIKAVETEMEQVSYNLENIIPFSINYYRGIKKKYSKGRERKTEIRNFDTIEAAKVAVKNEKLYVNRHDGFIGTGLKKDEFVCECSDIDDIIVFRKDGTYLITKVEEKSFVGKDIIHAVVFKKNDDRTIYNVVFRDGRKGNVMIKRFAVVSITRDREYYVTKGKEGSRILYFSANANGEAEVIKVFLKPKPRIKKLVFEYDFSELAIKGRGSQGNILTKNDVHRITLKEQGVSTLEGRKIWFDEDVFRLNTDGRGKFIGKFSGDEMIQIISKSGYFRLSTFELSNHYEDDILLIEKYTPGKVYSVIYYDADKGYYYLKRFQVEETEKKLSFIGDNPESKFISLTEVRFPRLEMKFGGKSKEKKDEIIEVAEFIGVKNYKAKGKRLTTFHVDKINWIEPVIKDEDMKEEVEENSTDEKPDTEDKKAKDSAQMTLFN